MTPPETLEAATRHPSLDGVAANTAEDRRLRAFAHDIALHLWGAPWEMLGPLARVVTLVARRELDDAAQLCNGRPLLAVEAGARIAAGLWPLLRWDEPPPEEGLDETREALGGLADALPGDPADDPELEALAQRLTVLGGDPLEQASETFEDQAAVGVDAAMEADEIARHLEDLLPGVGWSSATGELERRLLARLQTLSALIAKLPELRELVEHLGRLEGHSRKKGPQEGGREEVAGVRLSGDVATALPLELALLGDRGTEDLFYQRLAEHRLISLELQGRGDEGVSAGERRGPVICCIDTSASMEGEAELVAKATVLAVSRRMLPQGRTVHLLMFGGPQEFIEIRLKRGKGGLEGILDFLEQGFHGGTDFDGPLIRALELLNERDLHRADILIVTDGLGRVAHEVVEAVALAREHRGLRVQSVLIGRHDERGVAGVSDEVRRIDLGDPG